MSLKPSGTTMTYKLRTAGNINGGAGNAAANCYNIGAVITALGDFTNLVAVF